LRERFKNITVLYGARSVADLVYKHELQEWQGFPNVQVITTVDPGGDTPEWKGEVGFVPAVLDKHAPSSADTIALLCGPPIMIKLTLPVLLKLGFSPDTIYTTLENRMKCGIGKCGRCNVGKHYVCIDGPVFTFAQVDAMPPEY
jgi:NAD(P)H-flavin reductase